MADSFLNLVNWIDVIIKVATWIIVLIAAFVLFGKQIKAGILIKNFFKTNGIGFFRPFIIPFLSRSDCNKNTRLFIEYVILTTTDSFLSGKEWKNKILDFRAEYIEKKDVTILEIENTFILKNTVVSENIDRYFVFIEKNKDILNVSKNDIGRFLMQIEIKNAYLTPLIQISSLQERYNEDWSQVLNHYAFEFVDRQNPRIPVEVSSFYTWLMWGPSVCVIPHANSNKLCLLGLGDESMSVPVVIPANSNENIWNQINKNIDNNSFGVFVKGKYTIYNKIDYLKNTRNLFEGVSLNFIDAEILENSSGMILETTNDLNEVSLSNYINTMFSAYIWIMLYYNKKGEHKAFDCKNSTVFFEHANISDSDNVKLYTDTLINKCIEYLKYVKSQAQYSDREYTLAWAVNKKIGEAFKEKIEIITDLADIIRFDKAKISQDSILSSVDDAFKVDEIDITYKDIDFNNIEDLGLLGRFYCELYMIEFPDEDERESLENIIAQGRRMHPIKECEYHCVIATKGNSIVGGILGDYFAECNSSAIEFVVVNSKERGLHIGTHLINRFIDFCNNDANISNSENRSIDYCFFECENPNKVDESIKDNCIKRLHFWHKKSALRIDFDYIQTSLEESKQAIDYLYLNVIIINQDKFNKKTISKEKLMSFIGCYFKYAFDKVDYENNKEYKIMMNTNEKKEVINLLQLVN